MHDIFRMQIANSRNNFMHDDPCKYLSIFNRMMLYEMAQRSTITIFHYYIVEGLILDDLIDLYNIRMIYF